MRKFLIAALFVVSAWAQQVYFSTAPTGGKRYEVTETLGTQAISASGSRVCGGHSATVVRASAATLTLFSGAAAATPQYIFFPTFSQAATATSTLTLSGAGSNAGTVWVWATTVGSTTTSILAGTNISGATLACSGGLGCSQQAGVVTGFPVNSVPLWAWSVTSGSFDSSNTASGDAGLTKDCWVDMLMLSNTTGVAVTVTIQDGLGNQLLPAVSVPAGPNVTQIPIPGGRVFRGGLFWNAGTASSITGYARFVRQVGPATAP